jgi:hypothetical protein
MSLEFYEVEGLIACGRLKFRKESREFLEAALMQFADGYVSVRVERVQRHRTSRQNRFWHGVIIPLFAEHCGYHVDEMKRTLAVELLPVETTRLDGSVVITGGRTSELTVKQFNDLIERAQQLGAEMGIVIPDPNQAVA